MMIKPIDNLIQMNAEYKVDLISNLLPSENASYIKYALFYKDFNPKKDYEIINKNNIFKPTLKWWVNKFEQYRKQDEKHNQTKEIKIDISKCVREKDFDNNKRHQIDNCLLTCAKCNRLRQRDDGKITRTKIQLKKFCKLHHLRTLITHAMPIQRYIGYFQRYIYSTIYRIYS